MHLLVHILKWKKNHHFYVWRWTYFPILQLLLTLRYDMYMKISFSNFYNVIVPTQPFENMKFELRSSPESWLERKGVTNWNKKSSCSVKEHFLTSNVELKRQTGKRTVRKWHELPPISHEIKFNLHQGRGKFFYKARNEWRSICWS